MNWLAPFQHEFMLVAMGLAALVGAVCAVFSCLLVLKGWSLMGDAISHAVLPGLVLAYVAGVPLILGAFASGLLCAVGTGFIKSYSRVKEDTVLGVVFTGLFALGLVMFTQVESDQHLTHILFGSPLGVPKNQLWQTAAVSLLTLSITLLRGRDLVLFCFDAGHARSVGLNTTRLHYLMLTLLALTVVVSLQAVGVILVVAMLITPGSIGFLLAARFARMVWVAVGAAVFASAAGVYASFFLNASTGACIVLVQTALFIVALVLSSRRGLLAQWRQRRRLVPGLRAGGRAIH